MLKENGGMFYKLILFITGLNKKSERRERSGFTSLIAKSIIETLGTFRKNNWKQLETGMKFPWRQIINESHYETCLNPRNSNLYYNMCIFSSTQCHDLLHDQIFLVYFQLYMYNDSDRRNFDERTTFLLKFSLWMMSFHAPIDANQETKPHDINWVLFRVFSRHFFLKVYGFEFIHFSQTWSFI